MLIVKITFSSIYIMHVHWRLGLPAFSYIILCCFKFVVLAYVNNVMWLSECTIIHVHCLCNTLVRIFVCIGSFKGMVHVACNVFASIICFYSIIRIFAWSSMGRFLVTHCEQFPTVVCLLLLIILWVVKQLRINTVLLLLLCLLMSAQDQVWSAVNEVWLPLTFLIIL